MLSRETIRVKCDESCQTEKDKTGRGAAYLILFVQYLAAVTDESGAISQGNKSEAEGLNTTPLNP